MKAAIALIAIVLSGCSYLMTAQDKSAEQIAKGIAEYCKNTDAAFRDQFRTAINEKAAPNSIAVNCGQ